MWISRKRSCGVGLYGSRGEQEILSGSGTSNSSSVGKSSQIGGAQQADKLWNGQPAVYLKGERETVLLLLLLLFEFKARHWLFLWD